jgi:Skp family chaperone for outer membrane proteins
MRAKPGVTVGLIVLAGILLMAVWSPGWAQGTPTHRSYAVVDLARVLDGCQQSVDVDRMLQERRKQIETDLEARRTAFETKQADLSRLAPDSAEAYKLLEEIDRLQVEYEAIQKIDQAELTRERELWVAEGYKNAMAVISQIAEERGLDMVLFRDHFDPARPSSEIIQAMPTRKVLYAREALDISEDVKKLLDKQYQQRGGAASIKIGL